MMPRWWWLAPRTNAATGQRAKVVMQRNGCPNFNHGRTHPPVRFCPMCGEVVNQNIPVVKCSAQEHAERRRERSKHCVN